MNGFQAIKRQLLPLLRGLPIILGVFGLSLFLARKVILYTPNTYQTIARIKLDDQRFGFSNSTLYSDFDVFAVESRVQSEAILLSSPVLIGMAHDSLDFEVSIYRKGKVKNTMLYDDSPILVSYDFLSEDLFDKDYTIRVLDDGNYVLLNIDGDVPISEPKVFGQPLMLEGGILTIEKNDVLLAQRELDLAGDYVIHIFSRHGLMEDVRGRLDVTEMDKEIQILRVVYKDQHPKKVAALANAICQTYVNDYIATKSEAAQATVVFIDQKIDEVHLIRHTC